MQTIKVRLYHLCLDYLQDKIDRTRRAMAEAQDAANNETKSSVGDKYETGRAMMQIEIEKLAGQLAEWKKQEAELLKINAKESCNAVAAGALVQYGQNFYYIAIAAAKLSIEGQVYLAISPSSPIGALLLGKKKGDEIEFRGQKMRIEQLF